MHKLELKFKSRPREQVNFFDHRKQLTSILCTQYTARSFHGSPFSQRSFQIGYGYAHMHKYIFEYNIIIFIHNTYNAQCTY